MRELTQIYSNYLRFYKGKNELMTLLKLKGQQDMSLCLERYFTNDSAVEYTWKAYPWNGHKCIVDTVVPVGKPGLLWVDPISLTCAVYVTGGKEAENNAANWMDIKPLQIWQFITFLELADWNINSLDPVVTNHSEIMNKKRFAGKDEMEFVMNIYHEEAVAAGLWFGKVPISAPELLAAIEYLEKEFSWADSIALWDFIQHPDESMRYFNSIKYSPPSVITREIGEWKTKTNLGVLLTIGSYYNQIRLIKKPTRVYEFMILGNSARDLTPKL